MQTRSHEFVAEAREHLAIIEQCLLRLERDRVHADRADIDRCFRAVHSLKGDAGILGYRQVRLVAHAMETLLESIRATTDPPAERSIEALLAGIDALGTLLDDVELSNAADVSAIERRLAECAAEASSGASADRKTASATVQETAKPPVTYRLNVDLSDLHRTRGMSLARFFRELAAQGTIRDPRVEFGATDLSVELPREPVRYRAVCITALPIEQSSALAVLLPSEIERVEIAVAVPSRVAPPREPSVPAAAASESATKSAASAEPQSANSIRVHVDLLERLMTLVGELTLVRNQALVAIDGDAESQCAVVQRLNALTAELQEAALRTRMQPVGNLFGRFPRLVRDLAREFGKQIEVVLVGREVELDKTVLEQLSDPLTHLVRNSVDHGIELPDDRAAAGKPRCGRITLTASHEEGHVQIEIRDDGHGIDPKAVRAKALGLGLKTVAELDRMTERELASLILLPGFSTAKAVTEVSGRGVGMDVVNTNVGRLQGSLTIASTAGVGTSMIVRVPLTLAIIPCLIVTTGGERYAIPQRDIDELVSLHGDQRKQIEWAFDQEVYRLRERLLPLVRLQDVLARRAPFTPQTKSELAKKYSARGEESAQASGNTQQYFAVLKTERGSFGLLIDNVLGTEEIVVKPMQETMRRLGIYSGTTIMGDGRVALILDSAGLAEHAGIASGGGLEPREVRKSKSSAGEGHSALLFEYGPNEQFALPLLQVRRIESIRAGQIERVGDDEFIALDGLVTRVARLDRALNVSACEPHEALYLLLPKSCAEPVGLLASRIVDTERLYVDLQNGRQHEDGILGSAMVRDRLTLFLDMYRVIDKTRGLAIAAPVKTGRRPRILVVDDTAFFRSVVSRYFEDAGYDVTTASDGQHALAQLDGPPFDLVVSDIEMPVMDGWSLAQAIRERGLTMPLLALTSLAGEEHVARAMACGYDRFEVKLDRDRLLAAVAELLSAQPVRT